MKGHKIPFLIGSVPILIVLVALFTNTATKSAIAYNNDYSAHSIITPTPIYRDLHHGIFTNESIYSLHLDSTSVRLTIPFTITNFTASSPDDIFQMATSVQYEPFLEVRLIALPISSTQLINYVLGISEGEKYTSFNQALDNARQQQNSVTQAGREIYMFGEEVRSISNLVSLNINQDIKEPVVIHEWLTQHNERLWIFRISYGHESGFADSRLQGVSISMENSETVLHLVDQSIPEQLTSSPNTPSTPNDLPFPPWWNGDCDVNHFPGSYPLGGIYNGVKACGPLNTTRRVNFGAGVDQFEWQCPELSKRYLYLAYGTPPYSAHGKDVVWNYLDTDLEKVPNGTPNKAPKPGSVLSYGSTDPYGHTSIVSSANVDSNGNGTITVIEQNWSSSGTRTHTVSNWFVHASMEVSGWLYDPGGTPPPPTGQVKLWSQANYSGNVVWSGGTGFSNDPSANSYSLELPSGWSAKTWRGDNRSGEERCWSSSVNNLQDHGWQNAIQSIEVFNSNVCSSPPHTGQVKLWSQANYGGNVVWSGGTGFSNDPSANSYSLELPSGWSAKTWRGDNRSGEEQCWSSSVNNLQDHGWQNAIQSMSSFGRKFTTSFRQKFTTSFHPDFTTRQGGLLNEPGSRRA